MIRLKWYIKEHLKIIVLALVFFAFLIVIFTRAAVFAKAADALENFKIQIFDGENTVYEYEMQNMHIPSYELYTETGTAEESSEVIWLENFAGSIENDKSKRWEEMDDLSGGSTWMYITVTAKDGSVLYAEIIGDHYRYTLTTPEGDVYKSRFKFNEVYLRNFLIAHDCNDG